jgi:hypothetical protein
MTTWKDTYHERKKKCFFFRLDWWKGGNGCFRYRMTDTLHCHCVALLGYRKGISETLVSAERSAERAAVRSIN